MKRYYAPLLIFYTLFLLYMMFYGCGRVAGEIGYIQLKPFKTIKYFLGDNIAIQKFAVNIIGNILVFIPFGWLSLWSRKKFSLPKLIVGFPIAVAIIEMVQYFSGRGTADVDDLFLNTFGMLLGYLLLKIFEILCNEEFLYGPEFSENEVRA